jgi:hypothetical protein
VRAGQLRRRKSRDRLPILRLQLHCHAPRPLHRLQRHAVRGLGLHLHGRSRLRQLPQLPHLRGGAVRDGLRQRAEGDVCDVLRRLPGRPVHERRLQRDGRPRLRGLQLVHVLHPLLHGSGVRGEVGRSVRAVHCVRLGAVRCDAVRGVERRGVRGVRYLRRRDVRDAGVRRQQEPVSVAVRVVVDHNPESPVYLFLP